MDCFWPVPKKWFKKKIVKNWFALTVSDQGLEIIESKRNFFRNLGVYRRNVVILSCAFTDLVQNRNLLCNHGWQCNVAWSRADNTPWSQTTVTWPSPTMFKHGRQWKTLVPWSTACWGKWHTFWLIGNIGKRYITELISGSPEKGETWMLNLVGSIEINTWAELFKAVC